MTDIRTATTQHLNDFAQDLQRATEHTPIVRESIARATEKPNYAFSRHLKAAIGPGGRYEGKFPDYLSMASQMQNCLWQREGSNPTDPDYQFYRTEEFAVDGELTTLHVMILCPEARPREPMALCLCQNPAGDS